MIWAHLDLQVQVYDGHSYITNICIVPSVAHVAPAVEGELVPLVEEGVHDGEGQEHHLKVLVLGLSVVTQDDVEDQANGVEDMHNTPYEMVT